MAFVLNTAAAPAPPPTVLPLPRRFARALLLAAAARAGRLAARLENVDAPPRAYAQPRAAVRFVEAAVLFAVAAYFAAGVFAVLAW